MSIESGIHDNHKRGAVGAFLKEKIQKDAELSIVSAYFTIYAFEALKEQLLDINHLNFLFGEPGFIRSLDPDKTVRKFFKIVDQHLELAKRLKQKQIAKECAEWIRRLKKVKPEKLSQAAMETLAILAYRQPTVKAEIEQVRGVDSGWVLNTLLEKGGPAVNVFEFLLGPEKQNEYVRTVMFGVD